MRRVIYLSIILFFTTFSSVRASHSKSDTLNKITFVKKKNAKRLYKIITYSPCSIVPKHGKKIVGYIFRANDSMMTIGTHVLKNNVEAIKVLQNRKLSRKERMRKYIDLMYCDTVKVNFNEIKRIVVWEQAFTPKYLIGFVASLAASSGIAILSNDLFPPPKDPQDLGMTPLILLVDIGIIVTLDYYLLFSKRISPKRWSITK